jgi:hypothetical protein
MPAKNAKLLRLICTTTDGQIIHAILYLTPERARTLLGLAALHKELAGGRVPQLYSIEFFTDEVDYGYFNFNHESNLNSESWFHWAYGLPASFHKSRTAATTARVTETGVHWSAAPKHGDIYFETREIRWEDLAKVAAGENPFEPVAALPESEGDHGEEGPGRPPEEGKEGG